jgi:PIN domain nuclease of toxin-antitoxin system
VVELQKILPNRFVLDSSFLVPLLNPAHKNNHLADRFKSRIGDSVVNAVNLGETFYTIYDLARIHSVGIESVLSGYGVMVEPFTADLARNLNELRRIDRLRRDEQESQNVKRDSIKSLSLGDMSCLSQAMELGLPVLTGDTHWFALNKHGLNVVLIDYRDVTLSF